MAERHRAVLRKAPDISYFIMIKITRLTVGALKSNCYLLVSGGEACVIDPGGEADEILAALARASAELKIIVNTHGHPDHMLADYPLKRETNAGIMIHEAEKPFLKFVADRYLREGDIIGIGSDTLEVIHVPGHTPGGICLLGRGFIFTGDTLFRDGYGRTDLAGGSPEDMAKSLRRLSRLIRPGMTVYPGHGEYYKA